MPPGKAVERLAGEIVLHDLTLELDAVCAMSNHGLPSFESPTTRSMPFHKSVRLQGRTPLWPLGWQAWKEHHGRWAWVLWFEWASEWIVHWSQSWDFVKVLELVSKFALLVAAVSWVWEYNAREQARLDALKAKHYRAWELIDS